MKHLTLLSLITLALIGGCQKPLSQSDIEGDLRAAISAGQPGEAIEAILTQAENPTQAANAGIDYTATFLSSPPQNILQHWRYYKPSPLGQTPTIEIMEVLNRYQMEVYEVLVRHGGDLNRKHEQGTPVIKFSVFSEITPDLLQWLLEHGYDANMAQNNLNWTALSYCCLPNQSMLRYDQKYEMIKMLLAHGANPNIDCLTEPAMLTIITYHKDNPYVLDIIQLLIDAGYDLNAKGFKDTALVTALGLRRDDVAMLLLEHTDTIDSTDQFGCPLVNLAAAYNNIQSLELMISRGVNLNTADRNGNSPLHAATAGRNPDIAAMLIDAGADIDAINSKNQTPLDIALQQDNCQPDEIKQQQMIDLLKKHGAKTGAQLKETDA